MNRYPCPDCEDALGPCSGIGCPAKGMETWPFRDVVVCRVPERKKAKREPVRCVRDGCPETFVPRAGQVACSRSCRDRMNRARINARRRARRAKNRAERAEEAAEARIEVGRSCG